MFFNELLCIDFFDKKIKKMLEKMIFYNQINKLLKKFYSNISQINIHYYLKIQIPIMHRHFFKMLSEFLEYVQTHCNNRRKPFHFACRKWYLYNIPQC